MRPGSSKTGLISGSSGHSQIATTALYLHLTEPTRTQQLLYHPHVHCLVTGGGISADGRDWYPARDAFLFPDRPLAKLVRDKFRALLTSKRPDLVPPHNPAWVKRWIVNLTVS